MHTATDPASKYLTFHLGEELFALPILRVQEIVAATEVTPVPATPRHVLGIVDLRGAIVPVLDLRRRFSLPDTEWTDETCIVIVQARDVVTGLVVDRVADVTDITAGEIAAPPALGRDAAANLLGVARTGGHVCLVLDLEGVVRADDATELAAASASAPG